MFSRFTYIVALLALLVIHPVSRGADMKTNYSGQVDRAAVADSLKNALVHCSQADSLGILFDLYDLSPRSERNAIAASAVDLALKLRETTIGLDMLRNLANGHYQEDSLLQVDRALAMKFPAGIARDETVCFIDILRNYSQAEKSVDYKSRIKMLDKLVAKTEMTPATEIFGHLVDLHAICLYLSDLSDSQMLSRYIHELDSLSNTLRQEAYFLRNLIYVQSSLAYNNSHITRYRRAKYDRKALAVIDSLESGKLGMRRKYRNYDANRYLMYTRIMATYDSLPKSEVEDLYAKAMQLVATDSVIAQTNSISLRPQIYKAMKDRDYAKALPLLKQAVNMPYNKNVRFYMLRMLIDAAQDQNDFQALLSATKEYNEMVDKVLEENIHQKWRELEIMYDINNIRIHYNNEKALLQKRIIRWAFILAAVLAVLLVVMIVLFVRSRKLAHRMRDVNITLMMQRDHIRRTREELASAKGEVVLANKTKKAFVSNLSDEVTMPLHVISEYIDLIVDNSQVSKKPYLKHYVDMVVLNAEMLSTLVKDLNILFEIDKGTIKLHPKTERLMTVCNVAVESVRHRLQPGVTIELASSDPDIMVKVDTHRLMQILWQLLSNAAKFTSEGLITVAYAANPDGKTVTLSVSDTGIGISEENAERIFDRFVKLDPGVPGAGIGLPLARQMAMLMNADLKLDPDYTQGARFTMILKLA